MFALARFVDAHYLVALYLIPITVAMLLNGFLHVLVTAFASALVATFFFYQPVFSFYIADPEEAVELIIFGILGSVIAYLVTVLREISRTGCGIRMSDHRSGEYRAATAAFASSKRQIDRTEAFQR